MNTFDNQKSLLYLLSRNEYESSNFTCDLYPIFRRGKLQKVLSLTLFGNNNRYFKKIGRIIKQAKRFYPDWFIRIYTDESLNRSIKCMYECSPDDNVDFCNVRKLPLNRERFLDASFIIPTMWRFLPIGDSFVKILASRDSDSYIIKRFSLIKIVYVYN